MGIENAVYFRMVSHIAGISVANMWGYMPKSSGYEESERIFNRKYQIISFSQLKDEIILKWCSEYVKKNKIKMSMAEVLDEKKPNEENRPLFTRVAEKVKEQNKENILNGIPKEVKDKGSVVNDTILDIDNGFAKIAEAARTREIGVEFSNEEINKILLGIDEVKKLEVLSNMDTDSFLESVLKAYNKKIIDSDIQPKEYNEEIARLIKTNFFAKLNTLPNNKNNARSRNRTKDSIFDKIDDGKISNMSIKEFSTWYNEIIELYDVFEDGVQNIDELVEFYDIESKYNIVFYTNVALDLIEDTSLTKKVLANRVSKLALLDSCIYRSSTMKAIVNRIIFEFNNNQDKIYKEICNEISELQKLKDAIVTDMLLITALKFENLKEEALNTISDNAKEEIYKQTQKVDIGKYLDIKNDEKMLYKAFKNMKYLLENNKEILLERNNIINKLK